MIVLGTPEETKLEANFVGEDCCLKGVSPLQLARNAYVTTVL
jgi:hypothetical protein